MAAAQYLRSFASRPALVGRLGPVSYRGETLVGADAGWLARYGANYATDAERKAAYRDFKANLAALAEVFDHSAALR
ncbi:hypothetical protein MSM1_07930 [Mycobacterium sp. SM1]|uniref:hypothetical protein n=1 Tax=Mycobacterium sp. SM1 TaxID=2816243 RepID=UPI001BCD0246|nr:hypothetical protein [Mycobacterium sp. SM1]MBS4728273.1 hypothetical protein [Mycobacterium sp. SM1]